jgi:hypothetical protein
MPYVILCRVPSCGDVLRIRRPASNLPGEPKVGDFNIALGVKQNVLRLDIYEKTHIVSLLGIKSRS